MHLAHKRPLVRLLDGRSARRRRRRSSAPSRRRKPRPSSRPSPRGLPAGRCHPAAPAHGPARAGRLVKRKAGEPYMRGRDLASASAATSSHFTASRSHSALMGPVARSASWRQTSATLSQCCARTLNRSMSTTSVMQTNPSADNQRGGLIWIKAANENGPPRGAACCVGGDDDRGPISRAAAPPSRSRVEAIRRRTSCLPRARSSPRRIRITRRSTSAPNQQLYRDSKPTPIKTRRHVTPVT